MKVRQKLKAFGPGRPSNFLTHLHTPSVGSGLRDGVQSTLRLTNQISCLSAVGTYQFRAPESTPLDSPVGRIKANDADVDENAEIEYSITEGDGYDMFGITTDKDTQEGIITVKKVQILT